MNKLITSLAFTTGVGLFLNDAGPIENNTVVQGSDNFIGTLYCFSGSRDLDVAKWYFPNGSLLESYSNNGTFVVVQGGITSSSYVALQQVDGAVLDPSEEGVYTCEILDHNGTLQTLHIGIYNSNISGIVCRLFLSVYNF